MIITPEQLLVSSNNQYPILDTNLPPAELKRTLGPALSQKMFEIGSGLLNGSEIRINQMQFAINQNIASTGGRMPFFVTDELFLQYSTPECHTGARLAYEINSGKQLLHSLLDSMYKTNPKLDGYKVPLLNNGCPNPITKTSMVHSDKVYFPIEAHNSINSTHTALMTYITSRQPLIGNGVIDEKGKLEMTATNFASKSRDYTSPKGFFSWGESRNYRFFINNYVEAPLLFDQNRRRIDQLMLATSLILSNRWPEGLYLDNASEIIKLASNPSNIHVPYMLQNGQKETILSIQKQIADSCCNFTSEHCHSPYWIKAAASYLEQVENAELGIFPSNTGWVGLQNLQDELSTSGYSPISLLGTYFKLHSFEQSLPRVTKLDKLCGVTRNPNELSSTDGIGRKYISNMAILRQKLVQGLPELYKTNNRLDSEAIITPTYLSLSFPNAKNKRLYREFSNINPNPDDVLSDIAEFIQK